MVIVQDELEKRQGDFFKNVLKISFKKKKLVLLVRLCVYLSPRFGSDKFAIIVLLSIMRPPLIY